MEQNFNNAPDIQPDNRGVQGGTEQNNAAQYQQSSYQQGNPYQQNNQYQQNNSYHENNQ